MQSMMEHIVSDPEIVFGKPRIAGTRITVRDIVINHLRNGMPLELIAADFDVPLAGVYAAMTYYYDHKNEIDRSIEEGNRFVEEFKNRYDSTANQKFA